MNKNVIRAIAIVEMIGGIVGVATFFFLGIKVFSNILIASILSFFIALYILSFLAGLWLWKFSRRGIILSVIMQLLQIPIISFSSLYYKFFSGLNVSLGFFQSKLSFYFNLGSSWELNIPNTDEPSGFGLNIVAIIFLICLLKFKKAISSSQPSKA